MLDRDVRFKKALLHPSFGMHASRSFQLFFTPISFRYFLAKNERKDARETRVFWQQAPRGIVLVRRECSQSKSESQRDARSSVRTRAWGRRSWQTWSDSRSWTWSRPRTWTWTWTRRNDRKGRRRRWERGRRGITKSCLEGQKQGATGESRSKTRTRQKDGQSGRAE